MRLVLTSALRNQLGPIAVLAAGTVGLLALGIASGQANWPVYAVVVLLGAAVVTRVHLRVGLSTPTIWGLVAFALGHLAGGMVPVGEGVLYGQWLVDGVLRYDNVQHAVGFGFVGRAVWEVLERRLAPPERDRPGVAMWIVVLGATAAGSVNEIVEYVLTLVLPANQVGGYDNTARDLIANLVGGLAVGWWTSRSARSRGNAATAGATAARRGLQDEGVDGEPLH